MAQLLPPLIQLPGLSRYDLMACSINIDHIANWSKIKNKLKLSDKETEKLYKSIKATLMINAKEEETKNGINLKFSKKTDSESFNGLLRQFIIDFKICKKCSTPELVDNNCNACGFNSIAKSEKSDDQKPKVKLLSKAEKDAIKAEEKRLEMEEKEKKKPKRKQKNKEDIDSIKLDDIIPNENIKTDSD